MGKSEFTAIILAATLSLGGCGKGTDDQLSKGQVVANVDGEDITIHELNAELAGMPIANDAQRDVAKRVVLQRLIDRRILADFAREKKLDESPEFELQRHRAEEQILVNLLERQATAKLAPTTRDDAQRFMAQNPQMFAQRRIYNLDQLLFDMPRDTGLLRAMQPLKSLEEIQALLDRNNIRYQRVGGRLDAAKAPPKLLAAIQKLPAGEVFAVPMGSKVLAAKIVGTSVVPFEGEEALAAAQRAAASQRLQSAITRELDPVIKKGRGGVKYQAGFEPKGKSSV